MSLSYEILINLNESAIWLVCVNQQMRHTREAINNSCIYNWFLPLYFTCTLNVCACSSYIRVKNRFSLSYNSAQITNVLCAPPITISTCVVYALVMSKTKLWLQGRREKRGQNIFVFRLTGENYYRCNEAIVQRLRIDSTNYIRSSSRIDVTGALYIWIQALMRKWRK